MGRTEPGDIVGIKATSHMVVVEMLNAQESMGTRLSLGVNAKAPPQGYILDIGPGIELDKYGFKVGDRVLLQGTYVPVPNIKGANNREIGVVQPHDIKCLLLESDD
jgi:hypothetical protein